MLFDYTTAANRVGISSEDLNRLVALMRAEFPGDEMMVELHVLRTVRAVDRGDVAAFIAFYYSPPRDAPPSMS
jgi:hypothetical protein